MLKKLFPVLFLLVLLFAGCSTGSVEKSTIDYREEMRHFVENISQYAKSEHPDFIIIPQNGIELVTQNGNPDDKPATYYLQAIDGNGQEDLFYGYDKENEATPVSVSDNLKTWLNVAKDAGKTILVTDYTNDTMQIATSYKKNSLLGYLSFAADHRDLNSIPPYPKQPYNKNDRDINNLNDAKNFLYLINPEYFNTKSDFIKALDSTDYDLIIMDLFFNDGTMFSADEIKELQTKAHGGKRLVIAYLSIGEAEDYRYYWKSTWQKMPPRWLEKENPNWPGNYKVKYWDPQWQAIIYGNDSSYLDKILRDGFDGAYLDVIDAFEYFESQE